MTTQTSREQFTARGEQVLERFRQLVHEGNVRRVVIKQGEHTVVEFPLTVGVVGAVLAPMVAAVGAVAALLTECTIEVERTNAKPADEADKTEPTPVAR